MMSFSALRDVLEHRVEISSVTGRPRFSAMHNDVDPYLPFPTGMFITLDMAARSLTTVAADTRLSRSS